MATVAGGTQIMAEQGNSGHHPGTLVGPAYAVRAC
jgi:hypothetical protein